MASFVTLYTQTSLSNFLILLFQDIVELIVFFMLSIHAIEEPQQEYQQQNGDHNSQNHPVELGGLFIKDTGTSFQLAVLTGLLLQINIDIAVIVALLLVVDSRISHRQLFTDTRHQVRSLVDALIA